MAKPERDGVSVWRIEGEQNHRHTNVTTPSIHGFPGTNVSPYNNIASPERDKRVPYEKFALSIIRVGLSCHTYKKWNPPLSICYDERITRKERRNTK
jgi:hypothetical protein